MFVNYFADATRRSPLNLAVARVILSSYILWRVASINAKAIEAWPVTIYPYTTYLLPPGGFGWVLIAEKWLVVVFATFLLVGYRIRLNAFLVALLFAHLTGAMMVFNRSGETQQMAIGVLLVALFGLYAEQDKLSVDGVRRTGTQSLSELNDLLQGSRPGPFRMDSLRYMLLTLGILYAGSAWAKIDVVGLFTWTSSGSLARHVRYYEELFQGAPVLGEFLIETPMLLVAATWGTLITEVGLLVAVLAGITITPIVIALLALHIGIYLAMGILFLDILFFLAVFGSFDRVHARFSSDREADLVYDEYCYLCARRLYPFKLLDSHGKLTFYSRSDAPTKYTVWKDGFSDGEIYVFVDEEAYEGYWAFRELLVRFWITKPVAWAMDHRLVADFGTRMYSRVSNDRDPD